MNYPELLPDRYERFLKPPVEKVSIIFDSDTFNEIDDQFALTYALIAEDRLEIKGMTAAPFLNSRATSPADGMEKSYQEMHSVLKLAGFEDCYPVRRGSEAFMSSCDRPVASPAAELIIEQALEHGQRDEILYIAAIGAITNVASAILMNPDIIQHITVVWLGGHPYYWPLNHDEFNLRQDVAAVQVIFDSGVPLVHIPCKNVAEQIRTCPAELEKHMKGRGNIGNYLYESFCEYCRHSAVMTKEIWDMSAIAWLVCNQKIMSETVPAPRLKNDKTWDQSDPFRNPIRVLTDIRRDSVFNDFFSRLESYASSR